MRYRTIDEYACDNSYRSLVNRIGIALLMFTVLFNITNSILIVIVPILYEFLIEIAAEITVVLLYSLAYMLSFMLPALSFKYMSRSNSYRRVKLNIKLSRNVFLMIFAGIAIIRAAAFINALLLQGISVGYPSIDTEPTLYGLVLNIIYIALVPAICEEFLFRGVILENMLPYGKTGAIVGSAVLFGIMHQNAAQLFYAMVAGLVFAFVYTKTGSLWTGMIIHFLNNALSVADDFILAKWGHMTYSVFYAVELFIIVLLGVISVLMLAKKEKRLSSNETCFKEGIYRKELPPSDDSAEHHISRKTAITGFFAPANALFMAITAVLLILTLILT